MLDAVDATIEALRSVGRLEAIDAGLVGMARTLARAMDDELAEHGSRFTVSALSGKLLPVLAELKAGGRDTHAPDDELESIVRSLGHAT